MEINRNWGWAAIAIGLVALGFAFGSRFDGPRHAGYRPSYGPSGYTQQVPPGYGPQGYEQRGPQGYERGWRGSGPFLFPFFFLGGLLKLALFGLLAFAALRFLRGRRPWGGPPWGRGGPWDGPNGGKREEGERERRGPEEPTSYTDGTVRL